MPASKVTLIRSASSEMSACGPLSFLSAASNSSSRPELACSSRYVFYNTNKDGT